MRLRLGDDAFWSGRHRSDRCTIASLEDETDDPFATTLQTPRSGYVPSPLFYQEWFESTYVGDEYCPTIRNFLEQMSFWKVLMEENGLELEDAYFINAILRRIPKECTKYRSYLEPLLESAVNYGTVLPDELDERLPSPDPQLLPHTKEAKSKKERKPPAGRKALPSSSAFTVEHIEGRLSQIHLECCVCVKDYLGRAYFWRGLLKEHGKTVSDSDFLKIMVRGLSAEYQQIGAHYNMLRTTPAFEKEMLDEFASSLRVLERDIIQSRKLLEQDIARFESSPSLSSVGLLLKELRNRRDPANVMQLDWRIRTYFGLVLLSLFFGALETMVPEQPPGETMESASLGMYIWEMLAIRQHLYLHFRVNDVFIHVVGWALLVLCTAGFNYVDPNSPFSWLSLLFKFALPLIVYHGLVVEEARGRLKGYRRAEHD